MGQSQLQTLLEEVLGSDQVFFQAPDDVQMTYPAIVYNLASEDKKNADNGAYRRTQRWTVTLITRDPLSGIYDKLAELPMCSFDRAYPADRLNHQVFNLYF